MTATLFPHQQAGADWLAARTRAYLGDEPGLGKTRTLIQALNKSRETRPLIVCPAIVRTHWQREFSEMRQFPYPLHPLVYSYDEIVRGGFPLMKQLIETSGVDALVLDEAHYLKHASAQRTKLLLGRDGYARRVPTVYAASGTPMPKHPGELWTILSSLFPEVVLEHGLRTYADWLARFCVMKGSMIRGRWVERVVGLRNVDELRDILDTVMLRRTTADVGLSLPELWWQVVTLDGDSDAVTQSAEAAESVRLVNEAIDAGRLDEIALDPHVARMRRRLGELKIGPVAEMLRSQLADSGEKVVIMAHHRNVLDGLREMMAAFGVAHIDGDTPPGRRDFAIEQFQTNPKCRVFVGQTIACQTGITLTAARRVVLVEPDWTAVVNQQAAHRVARIGQSAGRCVVQMIALAGTLDEAIVRQNHREAEMAERVLGCV